MNGIYRTQCGVALLVIATVGGCGRSSERAGETAAAAAGEAAPAAPSASVAAGAAPAAFDVTSEAASTDSVAAYLRRVQFDPPRPEQRLYYRAGGVLHDRTYATFADAAGADTLKESALNRGAVIARIVKRGPSFPLLGLDSDTTYVWVDSEGGRPRAVMIGVQRAGAAGGNRVERRVIPVLYGPRHEKGTPSRFDVAVDRTITAFCKASKECPPCWIYADSVGLRRIAGSLAGAPSKVGAPTPKVTDTARRRP